MSPASLPRSSRYPAPPPGLSWQFEAKYTPYGDGWNLYTRLRTAEREVVLEDVRAVPRSGLLAAQIEAAEEILNEWKAENVRSTEPSPAE